MAIIIGIGFIFLALLLSTALTILLKKTVGRELSVKKPAFFAYVQIVLTAIMFFISSTIILISVLASNQNDPSIKVLMYSSLAVGLQLVGIYIVGGFLATPIIIKKWRYK